MAPNAPARAALARRAREQAFRFCLAAVFSVSPPFFRFSGVNSDASVTSELWSAIIPANARAQQTCVSITARAD
jgi:hypothetical protein